MKQTTRLGQGGNKVDGPAAVPWRSHQQISSPGSLCRWCQGGLNGRVVDEPFIRKAWRCE